VKTKRPTLKTKAQLPTNYYGMGMHPKRCTHMAWPSPGLCILAKGHKGDHAYVVGGPRDLGGTPLGKLVLE